MLCTMLRHGGGGGGELEAASIVSNQAYLATLTKSLHEIDLARHNLMHALTVSINTANTQLTLLNNVHDNFVHAHPDLTVKFDRVISSLQMFVNDNSPADAFQEAITNYERLIAPLDVAANQLQELIQSIDPSIEFDDTDSEDISNSVQELAARKAKG